MLYKSITLLLAGCLMFSLLGCDKEDNPAEKVEESFDQAFANEAGEYEDTLLDQGAAEETGDILDGAAGGFVDKYEEVRAAVEEKLNEERFRK